jgi:uncharacterized integral membrane protein (TIGR00697 family)
MFFNAFSSFIKETQDKPAQRKYKIHNISYLQDKSAMVTCEVLSSGQLINFEVTDIISDDKLHMFSASDILLITDIYNKGNNIGQGYVNSNQKYYNFLSISFVLILILSNLAASKIFNVFDYSIPSGIFFIPLTYIISDIMTEVYGYYACRKVIRMAMVCNIIVSLWLYFITYLPADLSIPSNAAFNTIFALSPRIFIAAIPGYYIGETMNAYILSALKAKLDGKFFVFRAVTSTAIGAMAESIVFCTLAFYGIISLAQIISMVYILVAIKIMYEIAVMPITVRLVYFLKLNN